jgi:Tn3 transposase DDE domain
LLRWVCDQDLRRAVHKGTTKAERSHQFAKFLHFGSDGTLRSNNPADQEKAIVYIELVANAVAVQNVADQTRALHALREQGINISAEDLSYLSPYTTSRLKRFGQYPLAIDTEEMPMVRNLPAPPSAPTTAPAP